MNNNITLFSRYKRMINTLLAEGFTKYTANELNTFVGQYEKITSWKRWNNSPYYTTRTYQTALKELGCITKIKRGLWQMNGPIPEWFGSFHIGALSSKYALKDLEDHSIYWMNLPDEHKVNPWKTAVVEEPKQARLEDVIDASTGLYEPNNKPNKTHKTMTNLNIDETNTTIESGLITTTVNFTVTAPIGITFDCISHVNIYETTDNVWAADLIETELIMQSNKDANYKQIKNALDLVMGETAADEWLKQVDTYGKTKALEAFPNGPNTNNKVAKTAVVEGTYTKAQVEQILKAFARHIAKDVESAIENECESLDESDVVEVDFDHYDRRISIDLNTSSLSRTLSSAASDQIDMSYDDFDMDSVVLN
jgi:hypothetical protein